MSTRIYAVAKQLKMEIKTLVDLCRKLEFEGKASALAVLTDEEIIAVQKELNIPSPENITKFKKSAVTVSSKVPSSQPRLSLPFIRTEEPAGKQQDSLTYLPSKASLSVHADFPNFSEDLYTQAQASCFTGQCYFLMDTNIWMRENYTAIFDVLTLIVDGLSKPEPIRLLRAQITEIDNQAACRKKDDNSKNKARLARLAKRRIDSLQKKGAILIDDNPDDKEVRLLLKKEESRLIADDYILTKLKQVRDEKTPVYFVNNDVSLNIKIRDLRRKEKASNNREEKFRILEGRDLQNMCLAFLILRSALTQR
jgi:hypothetical protein